ncbi:MAG: ankyrin repeat domain-containing protein [Alphaproteobacteria bacterium]
MTHPLNDSLVRAAQEGDIPLMEHLVSEGAEVNMPGVHAPLVWAASRGHLETLRWLLDHGAEVNAVDTANGWTALMSAANKGQDDMVRLLMEHGADAAIVSKQGKTAKMCAVEAKHTGTASLLDLNPDQISFSWPLRDRIMQEVYHFPRRERVTLIRNGETGPVEAMQRESFSSLEDLSGLRKAFAEHRRMGGKLEESDVFQGHWPKTKLVIRKEM